MHQVVVIGSGPAGHTACIYLARANLSPLMLEGELDGVIYPGGLLTTTKTVENYPGFPYGIDGYELTEKFRQQSINYGTQIKSETVISINKNDNYNFIVKTKGNQYLAKSIIIATGSIPTKLNVQGYDLFWQKGISTCAVCDGGLYKDKIVAVVGGGDSAAEESLHLANLAKKVYLLHRRDKLRASKIMADRVLAHSKIEIMWNTEIQQICGNNNVESIIIKNNVTSELTTLNIDGLFVAIGHTPNTSFLNDYIECDTNGYIITDRNMRTNVEGIYAAGDVQDHKYRQAITAAGSGCIAALEVERWLTTQ